MLIIIFKLLLALVTTEAITEIVVKSEIFNPIRKFIFGLGQNNIFFGWLHNLLDCGYCFSVWSSALVTFLLFRDNFSGYGLNGILVMGILVLFIHRLSNVFHSIMDKVQDKD